MRNIIVSMRVTVDGFIAGPDGEMDWMEEFFDEALATYESELQKTVDTTLFGRVTYQGFASYWPKVALDPASPKGLVAYAHHLNAMCKLVLLTVNNISTHWLIRTADCASSSSRTC